MPPEQYLPPPQHLQQPPAPLPQRTRMWLTITAVVSAGYVLVGTIAGAKAIQELARDPTPTELRQAAVVEVAERWRNWPTGRIFPERLSYEPEQGGDAEEATRVGIAPGANCTEGVDPAVVPALRRFGCAAVLRATYLDATQGVVITMGVVAFRDPAVAGRVGAQFSADGKPTPAVRAVGFPGTVTARFNDDARQASYVRQGGPYLILATAGQTDGRPAKAIQKGREGLFTFASEMAERLGGELSKPARPDCTQPERWAC